jgi:hypothetical protein
MEQSTEPTTYALALKGLRQHQAESVCTRRHAGAGDRIHSKRPIPVSELNKTFDKEPLPALNGPPRPEIQRARRAREGLPWLPGN